MQQKREEPIPEEALRLRYPLFDPRTVASQPADLPPTPSEFSGSSPSVPRELDTREHITLPKDEEEEEPFGAPEEKEQKGKEEVKKEESPTPPPPPSPPTQLPEKERAAPAASPPISTPSAAKKKLGEKDKSRSPAVTPEKTPPRSTSRRSPSVPSVSPEPPSTTRAVAPPSTAQQEEPSVPLSAQTQPPSSPPAVPASVLPTAAPVALNPQLTESADKRTEAAMSPLEKLASARLGTDPREALEEAEAATAPCTPPAWEEGPVAAETEMQQVERTRRLQQKLLALEEGLEQEELRLAHDSNRRRRKFRRKYPRYRVGWRCVQAAIDFYADVQDDILEDIRMRLDAHEPRECRICRHIDYGDVPLLP